MIKFKKAFTMVELIMVIVVIAILAAMSIPRLKRDTRIEAINHVLMAIRYAQNTALHDDKHSNTSTLWERSFWRFGISRCSDGGLFYYIGSSQQLQSRLTNNEYLIDPANGKNIGYASGNPCSKSSVIVNKNITSDNIFLSSNYGISNVVATPTYVSTQDGNDFYNIFLVGFDNLGRTMDANFPNNNWPNHLFYITSDINLTFSFQDSSIAPFTIIIPKETGYAYLAENPKL